MNLGQQRRIIDDLEMALEDVGRGAAQLLGDLLDERLQLGRRLGHRPVEALDLGGNLARGWSSDCCSIEPENRFDAVGDAHHDSRTDTDSFTHDQPVSRFPTVSLPCTTIREMRPLKPTRRRTTPNQAFLDTERTQATSDPAVGANLGLPQRIASRPSRLYGTSPDVHIFTRIWHELSVAIRFG